MLNSRYPTETEEGGAASGVQRYSAFGEVRSRGGEMPTVYQYTGQLSQMEAVGLYHYGARWFDPAGAHFTQADTLVPELVNSLDWDRYAYGRGNPLKYTDPTGHMVACDKDDWACQTHWDDPVAEDWLMDDTETLGDIAIETIATILFEPLDWWSMGEDCYNGECSPWMLLGLLPFIPGSVGNKVDNIVTAVTKMDGATKSVDETLDLAIGFLGEGYVDMGNGRFLSNDGLRQVRMADVDILGLHGGGPHINFDLLGPNPAKPGSMTQIFPSIHIYLFGK